MATRQGGLELLNDPIAQELLHSKIPARLAYTWTDGTPRVVPIWFHWNGEQIVFSGPTDAPKTHAIKEGSKVAITIDTESFPAKVLLIRGTAHVTTVEGMVPEYASSAERYLGSEGGQAWVAQVKPMSPQMSRIAVTPEWVGILDFQQRFPSAIEKAIARMG